MITTKRMLVSISFEGFTTTKTEFLIPGKDSFVGIESGDQYPYGAVSYIGRAISASDIMRKAQFNPQQSANEELLNEIEQFLENLQSFRIGNVVKFDTTAGLVKVSEAPPRAKQRKLP